MACASFSTASEIDAATIDAEEMTYAQKLRGLFPEISLHWEDLLLLEALQIKYLPDRVAVKEFASLLHAHPVAHRFLVSKYPPISSFMARILKENKAVVDKQMLEEQCRQANAR